VRRTFVLPREVHSCRGQWPKSGDRVGATLPDWEGGCTDKRSLIRVQGKVFKEEGFLSGCNQTWIAIDHVLRLSDTIQYNTVQNSID
jgi:hypothetical protein